MLSAEVGDAFFNLEDLASDIFAVVCHFAIGCLVHWYLPDWSRWATASGDKDKQLRVATAPRAECTRTPTAKAPAEAVDPQIASDSWDEASGARAVQAAAYARADAWDEDESELPRSVFFPADPGRRLLEAYNVFGVAAGAWIGAKETALVAPFGPWDALPEVDAEPAPRQIPSGRQILQEYGALGAPVGFWAGSH